MEGEQSMGLLERWKAQVEDLTARADLAACVTVAAQDNQFQGDLDRVRDVLDQAESRLGEYRNKIARQKICLEKLKILHSVLQTQSKELACIQELCSGDPIQNNTENANIHAVRNSVSCDASPVRSGDFVERKESIATPMSARELNSLSTPASVAHSSDGDLSSKSDCSLLRKSYVSKITTISKKAVPKCERIPLIAHVTEDELRKVPSYVRNRVTCDKINDAIDEIQHFLQTKYYLLSQPASRLRGTNSKLYRVYMEQENEETRDGFFFTDSDLKSLQNLRLDATGKAILGVLRHLKRIKQASGAKIIRYLIVAAPT